MIIAYINGKVAYPTTSSSVKIKLDNPFIKDGEEKSMEIVFPMDLPENRLAFGPLNRLDTAFENADIDNCALLVDNIEVIRGTGTITSVSESEVKLQILSGKNFLNYRESFDDVFIDAIDYGLVSPAYRCFHNGGHGSYFESTTIRGDMQNKGVIGEPGKYVFLPIHDESNDYWCNCVAPVYGVWDGGGLSADGFTIIRAAVQPNLIFILKRVLLALGFTLSSCFFDKAPWNTLYVASARVSLSIKGSLPHWTAYKFLEEIRKLFNAVFIFDDKNKTVDIVEFNQIDTFGSAEITPVEEFSASYDEEGLSYLGSSNLEYELSSCERTLDVVPSEVRDAFTLAEYDNISALYSAFDNMSQREKLTTLFHCPLGWFFGRSQRNDNNEITSVLLEEFGWLTPLIRREHASSVQLNIVPVAMKYSECVFYYVGKGQTFNWNMFIGGELHAEALMAHVSVENQPTDAWFGGDVVSESEYSTVESVLIDGESVPSSDSEEQQLEVFFAGMTTATSGSVSEVVPIDSMPRPGINSLDYTPAFTVWRYASYYASVAQASLALNSLPMGECIGQFHNEGIQIKRNINGNNEVCFRFLWSGKPDPKKIYFIRNRKYICSRIEMDVQDGRISELKTGYFYEMTS